jgi:hypothetical protein
VAQKIACLTTNKKIGGSNPFGNKIFSYYVYLYSFFTCHNIYFDKNIIPKILLRVYPESISGHLANAIEAAVLNADDTG